MTVFGAFPNQDRYSYYPGPGIFSFLT